MGLLSFLQDKGMNNNKPDRITWIGFIQADFGIMIQN
jgi:hypothetical protein